MRNLYRTVVFAVFGLNLFSCGEDANETPSLPQQAASLEMTSARLQSLDLLEIDDAEKHQPCDVSGKVNTQFPLRMRVIPIHRHRDLPEILQHCLSVPIELIRSGQDSVPTQDDEWSCGVNSAARFAAMLGHPIADYEKFHRHGPGYLGWGPFPKIGANPEGIQDYLRERGNMSELSISQRCTKAFHPNWEIMVHSLQMGRPALALVMASGTSMHWVNIVARHNGTENWFYMETDGRVFELPGGDDELKNWMSTGHCMAQRFGFVERFNTITTTRNK